MKSIAKYGCLFIGSTIFAQTLLFLSYRIAHWKYNYTLPGGFHFGGSDFAVGEALVNGVLLGSLFGIALTLIAPYPPSKFREHKGRLLICLILVCIPFIKFTSDVIQYRTLDLKHQSYIDEARSKANNKIQKPNKSEQATPRKLSD